MKNLGLNYESVLFFISAGVSKFLRRWMLAVDLGESREILLVLKLVSEIFETCFLNLKAGGLTDYDRDVAFMSVMRRVTTLFVELRACNSAVPP